MDVKEAFSVTIVNPEGRVVTDDTLLVLGDGDVDGTLCCRNVSLLI